MAKQRASILMTSEFHISWTSLTTPQGWRSYDELRFAAKTSQEEGIKRRERIDEHIRKRRLKTTMANAYCIPRRTTTAKGVQMEDLAWLRMIAERIPVSKSSYMHPDVSRRMIAHRSDMLSCNDIDLVKDYVDQSTDEETYAVLAEISARAQLSADYESIFATWHVRFILLRV